MPVRKYSITFNQNVVPGQAKGCCPAPKVRRLRQVPTLLKKQFKFPRYNIKCRGKPDTT